MDRVFFSNSGTEAIDGAMKPRASFGRKLTKLRNDAKKHRFGAGEFLSWTHVRRHQRYFHGKYRLPFAPVAPSRVVRFKTSLI